MRAGPSARSSWPLLYHASLRYPSADVRMKAGPSARSSCPPLSASQSLNSRVVGVFFCCPCQTCARRSVSWSSAYHSTMFSAFWLNSAFICSRSPAMISCPAQMLLLRAGRSRRVDGDPGNRRNAGDGFFFDELVLAPPLLAAASVRRCVDESRAVRAVKLAPCPLTAPMLLRPQMAHEWESTSLVTCNSCGHSATV